MNVTGWMSGDDDACAGNVGKSKSKQRNIVKSYAEIGVSVRKAERKYTVEKLFNSKFNRIPPLFQDRRYNPKILLQN
jgi:hypothetical protein